MTRPWEDKPWFEQYQLALLESDPAALPYRVRVSEAAIHSRVEELGYGESDQREMIALNDAVNVLRVLLEHEHLRKRVS